MRYPVWRSSPAAWILSSMLLVSGLCSSCSNYSAYFPFRPVDHNDATPPPPGVRFAANLQGVLRVPTEGIPARQYELTIQIEQPTGPDVPVWEPVELQGTKVIDDEGQEFVASTVLISEDAEKPGKRAGPGSSHHYLVVFELTQAYRFESIGRARVTWKLRAADHRPLQIESSFVR